VSRKTARHPHAFSGDTFTALTRGGGEFLRAAHRGVGTAAGAAGPPGARSKTLNLKP